ncbi:oligosaccharide flippase family protein [Halobacterium noricense]|uniref:oligosaccharide flippase family protein n=1 Tax=Halobacterium noricense TaxID=223182 RepID=UPI001E576E14|nr:oligosaccharide flippase family protein [Halobacterium noricense]UHH26530.1 oligosaccharide flippase family protein [Halobacterium noricense]
MINDEGGSNAGNINLGLESLKGLIAKFVQAVLGFVGTILFARILGPEAFGGFYFLLSFVTISTRPLDGLGGAIQKRFSEHNAPHEELLGTVVLFDVAMFLVAGFGVWLFRGVITAETNVDNAALVFFLLFVTLGTFLLVQKLIGAAGHPGFQIWNDTLRSMLTLPLQIGFILAGFGAAGMGYGLASATLLVIPVGLFFIRVRPTLPSRGTIKSVWQFARYSIFTRLLGAASGNFDTIVLGAFLTTATVGYYQVAYRLTVPATFMMAAVGGALMPKVSNFHSRGEAISGDITNAISYNSILAIPLFFGAVALAQDIVVTVYGSSYAAAAEFLVGLALYQVLTTQTDVYQRTLSGIDRPDWELRIDGSTLLFNLVVGISLLFVVGAIGVVIATVLTEFLRLVFSMRAVRELVPDIEPLPRPLLDQVIAGGVMLLGVEALNLFVTVRSWFELVVLVGFGVLLYGGVLLGVSRHARNTLWSIYGDIARI